VLYQDGKIVMFHCPDYKPAVPQTPLHSWNIDKIKALTAGADKAVEKVLAMPSLQAVRPIVRAVTLRENKDGNLEFVVSNYVVDGSYRRSFPVDATTWTVVGNVKEGEQIPNPCETSWSVQQQQGTPDAAAEGATVPSATAGEEKPGFGSAQPQEEQKGVDSVAEKGAEKAAKGGKGGKGKRPVGGK
jgi:hypothetical protein